MGNIDKLLTAYRIMNEMGVIDLQRASIFVHDTDFFVHLCEDPSMVNEEKGITEIYPYRYSMVVDGVEIYCISSKPWTKQRIWNERVNYMVSQMNDTMNQYTEVMEELMEAQNDDERVSDAEGA